MKIFETLKANENTLFEIAPEDVVRDVLSWYNQSGIDKNQGISPRTKAAFVLYLLAVCSKSDQGANEITLNLSHGNMMVFVKQIHDRLNLNVTVDEGKTVSDLQGVTISENHVLFCYKQPDNSQGHVQYGIIQNGDKQPAPGKTFHLPKDLFLKYAELFEQYD